MSWRILPLKVLPLVSRSRSRPLRSMLKMCRLPAKTIRRPFGDQLGSWADLQQRGVSAFGFLPFLFTVTILLVNPPVLSFLKTKRLKAIRPSFPAKRAAGAPDADDEPRSEQRDRECR